MASPFAFLQNEPRSHDVHIALQMSPFFDMLNGRYYTGLGNIEFFNAGMYDNTFIAGGSNTQKTGLLVFFLKRFLVRYPNGLIIYWDTESTLDVGRLREAVDDEMYPGYWDEVVCNKDDPRFLYFAAKDNFDGTALHNLAKKINTDYLNSMKDKSRYMDTKFLDKEGKIIQIRVPIMLIDDSLSSLKFNEAAATFQEGDVDSGGAKNTRDMKIGNLKRILFEDVIQLTVPAGVRLWWTGQIRDVISIDGRPQEKQSTFIRPGKKINQCPKAVLSEPATGFDIIKGTALKQDQEWMYPNPNGKDTWVSPDGKQNPDLIEYSFSMYRNKGGASGLQLSFIGSQSEGILEDLSMYHVIKKNNYFGLNVVKGEWSIQSHACYLYPDVKVGRTTVRDKLRKDYRLYRAVSFCFQMWFMQTFWLRLESKFYMTPEELYVKIKDQGYDWNEFLDTIDYTHANPNEKRPILTTKELLLIALGEKKPHWHKK